jgi:hypothetical protein
LAWDSIAGGPRAFDHTLPPCPLGTAGFADTDDARHHSQRPRGGLGDGDDPHTGIDGIGHETDPGHATALAPASQIPHSH